MDRKDKTVQVRVTTNEFNRIRKLADDRQLSVSVYCSLVLSGAIQPTPREVTTGGVKPKGVTK